MALSETITNLGSAIINLVNAKVTNAISVNNTEIEGVLSDLQAQIDDLPEGEHSVNKNQITNCILEIPQRIVDLKMQSGGTYTQIVASIDNTFIYPNGFEEDGVTPHFDYVQFEEEVDSGTGGPSGTRNGDILLMPVKSVPPDKYPTSGRLWYYIMGYNIFAGPDKPSTSSPYLNILWYDTTVNKIKHSLDGGETWEGDEEICLPCAICSSDSTGFTAINQIFNGFGFMDKVMWVDKDVKVLFSDGLNEDGKYKNEEYTYERLQIATEIGDSTMAHMLLFKANYSISENNCTIGRAVKYFEQINMPPVEPLSNALNTWRNPQANKNYILWKNQNITDWTEIQTINNFSIGNINSNFSIATMTQPIPFQAVGYNDIDGKSIFLDRVDEEIRLFSGTFSAKQVRTIDLSDYLTDPAVLYIVYLGVYINTTTTLDAEVQLKYQFSISSNTDWGFPIAGIKNQVSGKSQKSCKSFWLPVYPGKKSINIVNSAATATGNCSFWYFGHRKIR